MRMYFWWGSDVGDYIFKGFAIHNVATLISTCAGLTALAIIYEFMKVLKTKFRQKAARTAPLPGLRIGECQNNHEPVGFWKKLYQCCCPPGVKWTHLLRDLAFYIMDSCISYFIMLTVMLYNGPMFISVILGTTIGYFIFGYMSRKINMENVQAKTTTNLCVYTCPEQSTPPMISPSPSTSSTSPIIRNEEDLASEDHSHIERL